MYRLGSGRRFSCDSYANLTVKAKVLPIEVENSTSDYHCLKYLQPTMHFLSRRKCFWHVYFCSSTLVRSWRPRLSTTATGLWICSWFCQESLDNWVNWRHVVQNPGQKLMHGTSFHPCAVFQWCTHTDNDSVVLHPKVENQKKTGRHFSTGQCVSHAFRKSLKLQRTQIVFFCIFFGYNQLGYRS